MVTVNLITAQVTSTTTIVYGVREGTTQLANAFVEQASAALSQHAPSWVLTGLVPGSTHTYKAAVLKVTSGTANAYHGPSYGMLSIKVEGVP
jgi:hypothetical protein